MSNKRVVKNALRLARRAYATDGSVPYPKLTSRTIAEKWTPPEDVDPRLGKFMEEYPAKMAEGIAGIPQAIWDTIKYPGQLLYGEKQFDTDEAIKKAVDTTGIAMTGSFPFARAAVGEAVLGSGPILKTDNPRIGMDFRDLNNRAGLTSTERAENLAKYTAGNFENIPPIVYHGTGNDINKFDTTKGAWFTDATSLANEYANKPGGNVIPAYISLKNPIEFVHAEQRKPIGEIISTALSGARDLSVEQINSAKSIINVLRDKYGTNSRPLFEYWNNDPDITKLFKTLGYDGISVFEKADKKTKTWSVFSPEQVKSAIGNAGTFDPKKLRLTEASGGSVVERALVLTSKKAASRRGRPE
jgi:hypothetical protein